jgi:hypothetical protein
MSTLEEVLEGYNKQQSQVTEDLPREQTFEEIELLSDYILNDNLQAIYDYYELKDKLDEEWVDRQMGGTKFPWE